MPFFTDRKPFAGLRSPIGRSYDIEPEDVRRAKSALAALGDYVPTPVGGVDGIPDRGFFKSLEAYQARRSLKVDGLMRPGGETERALKTDLAAAPVQSGTRSGARSPGARSEPGGTLSAALDGGVGSGARPEDPAEAAREKRLKEIAARNRKAWFKAEAGRLEQAQAAQAAQAASQSEARTQAQAGQVAAPH